MEGLTRSLSWLVTVLASPILQEYDASIVDDVAMLPAEFGN